MTSTSWLDARHPSPPPALARRIRSALDGAARSDGDQGEAALGAALALIGSIPCSDGSRDGAMILLAADALVTYAFEATAEHPERLDGFAAEAMVRIARSAEEAR